MTKDHFSLGEFHLEDLLHKEIKKAGLKSDQIESFFKGKKLEGKAIKWIIDFLMSKLLKSTYQKVEIIKVNQYDSVGPDGVSPSKLSGLVLIPKFDNQKLRVPIIGYQHATQIKRDLAPSQFNEKKPMLCVEVMFGLIYAAVYGNIVVMCDYQGMGEDDTCCQPYVNREPLSIAAADLFMYTVNQILPSNTNAMWNEKMYLVGYSEGGYTTMATAMQVMNNKKYSDTFKNVVEVAPCAGPYSLSQVMRNEMVREEYFGDGYFLPMVLRGFLSAKGPEYGGGIFTKERAIVKEAFPVWDISDGSHSADDVNALMKELGFLIPRKMLTQEIIDQLENKKEYWEPGTQLTPVFKALLDNDCYEWPSGIKPPTIRMYQGENDDRVPFGNSLKLQKSFKNQFGIDVPIVPMFHIPKIFKSIHEAAAPGCLIAAYYWFSVNNNNHGNSMNTGEMLEKGNQLVSENGIFSFRYQWDGCLSIYNLEDGKLKEMLYDNQKGSAEVLKEAGRLIYQLDGNLVLYDIESKVIWQSNTKDPNYRMEITNEGSLSFDKE